eukprot:GGOE01005336.1.p1 GENE.GGOE01005336.1~~GGOE01005336.1.p1  ORF type:complete len:400 (-),score=121.70 GGOE01005336.1:727-1884(-)
MSPVVHRLYRTLLQRARHFDAHPALKGILKDLNHFSPLPLRTLYSPSMQQSFVQLVRDVFRQPKTEGVNDELGFGVLRYLNQVEGKYYKVLYPSAEDGVVAAPSSAPAPSAPKDALNALTATQQHPLLQRLARMPDRYWAMPVPVREPPVAAVEAPTVATEALVPADPSAPQPAPAGEFHPITPGVVLATHPLSEWPFSKCAMLVLEAGPEHVSAVILNYPRVYPVGERNYVFPPLLRRQTCHVGGPVLSYEMPPVPNYFILHPHRAIPNCKVLLSHDERPVCLSTGDDIAAIGEFIAKRKANAEDFLIFAGSVVIPKFELQQQVQEGFWMPILASSEFVHSAGRLGRVFWDGLMQTCGGEFAHMPLVSALVERIHAEQAAAAMQ